jgi:putative endonuclease
MNNQYYYVYILTNYTNTVLYVGVTNDLVRRIYEHKQKLTDGFTAKYNVNKLVYFEIYQDPEIAIKREKTIKNLLRVKKETLIKQNNPGFNDLYQSII